MTLTKYEIARARVAKAKAEELAEFMDEYTSDNPYVYDDPGNPMTKEQIVQKTRDGWKEDLLSQGYSTGQIKVLETIL